MGIYRRADAPYWYLWIEKAPKGKQRVRTDILIGCTPKERADSKEAARQVYHAKMLQYGKEAHGLAEPERPALTFAEYAVVYGPAIDRHKGADREREILKTLMRHFGPLSLADITAASVRAWMTTRAQTVNNNTVNREVGLLKSMLRDAAPTYIPASPLAGMKLLPTSPKRRRLLQWDEEARLLMACEDVQELALLVLGIDTMQRMGDLLDLRTEDRRGHWIEIRDSKNGTGDEVPLSPRAALCLDAIPTDPKDSHYFRKFRKAENQRDWRGAVRQRLERLCLKANVPFGPQGITFHGATRKTGATRLLVGKQVPLSVVQRIGLWKSPDIMLRIYAEAQRDDLAAAVGQTVSPYVPRKRKQR